MAEVLEDIELRLESLNDTPWVTIVWNDPVNLMSYVSWVFRSYFGNTREEAERLMLLVHHEGRAVVASGGREDMERHVEAMHDFGLWATLTKEGDDAVPSGLRRNPRRPDPGRDRGAHESRHPARDAPR